LAQEPFCTRRATDLRFRVYRASTRQVAMVATEVKMRVPRSAIDSSVRSFNMLALFAALALTFEVADTWYAQDNLQGGRLFKEVLCDVPQFRKYVIWSLEAKGFDFVFMDTDGAAWLDSKRFLNDATNHDCDSSLWHVAEDHLLMGFDTHATSIWLNMHREEMGPLILKFQLNEYMYSWSMGCLIVCVIVCILGASVFSLAPVSPCPFRSQMPMLVLAVALLVVGLVLFVQAHNNALYERSSFSSKARDDEHSMAATFFILPVGFIAVFVTCLANVIVQVQRDTPCPVACVPGIYNVWNPEAVENEAGPGGAAGPAKIVERDV